MEFQTAIDSFWAFQTEIMGTTLDLWLMIFARVLAFVQFAPVIGRKDIPIQAKVPLAMFLSIALLFLIPHGDVVGMSSGSSIGHVILLLFLNAILGGLLGFIPKVIMETVGAAGGLITNQIGLQAANIVDPTTKQQNALLGPLFSFIATVMFIELGGIAWLLNALERSFEMFPLFSAEWDFPKQIQYEYLLQISTNVIEIGLLLAGPFFVVTLTVDIMLGIVNRAAQQIPVFQLSFGLKPAIGVIVFLLILEPLFGNIRNYLMDYSRLF